MKNLALYFHIPFCNSKCFYCDFDSNIAKYPQKKQYINALSKEIDMVYAKYNLKNYLIDTIFIGGGTPTSLQEDLLKILLSKIQNSFNFSKDIEYTIEINPNSINEKKIYLLKEYNVNRISIGLQSINDNELKSLGRSHSYKDFEKTYELLKKYDFKNINIDIMIGTPNQTFKSYDESLKKIISLYPNHISSYMLIIEENTVFGKMYDNNLLNIDDDFSLRLYEHTINTLEKNGYKQYEISNFAKKGFECKHNIKYWEIQEYLGLGQSAHSFFNSKRFSNFSNEYINKINNNILPICDMQNHSDKDEFEEWIFLKLRMNKGIFINDMDKRFNMDFREKYKEVLKKLYNQNLIQEYDTYLRLTLKGIELSNSVFLEFL